MKNRILCLSSLIILMFSNVLLCDGLLHDAEKEGIARSISSNYKTEIEFKNNTPELIKIYWIDFNGKRKLYNSIETGKSYTQQTFLTHSWLITDNEDNAINIYYSDRNKRKVIINSGNPQR